LNKNADISKWTIRTIIDLPKEESEYLEFKSGLTPREDLSRKISVAASAFSNATGGIFIIGINKEGQIDGVVDKVGRTYIRYWIDTTIHVEPMVDYKINIIKTSDISILEKGKCIVTIQFFHSHSAPHMASNNKYYFRNGAQSIPASHYLVEAIRLYANYDHPVLACRLAMSTTRHKTIQLEVFSKNKSNAYNVKISFSNLPELFHTSENNFPLIIPIINDKHPFIMDIDHYDLIERSWKDKKICIDLEYEDENFNKYLSQFILDEYKELPPNLIGTNALDKIVQAIEKIPPALKK
jgi:hypothetical protein